MYAPFVHYRQSRLVWKTAPGSILVEPMRAIAQNDGLVRRRRGAFGLRNPNRAYRTFTDLKFLDCSTVRLALQQSYGNEQHAYDQQTVDTPNHQTFSGQDPDK